MPDDDLQIPPTISTPGLQADLGELQLSPSSLSAAIQSLGHANGSQLGGEQASLLAELMGSPAARVAQAGQMQTLPFGGTRPLAQIGHNRDLLGVTSSLIPQASPGNAISHVLATATAEQLFQLNPCFRQLYDNHCNLVQERDTLQTHVAVLEGLVLKSKDHRPATPPVSTIASVTSFEGMPPYIPDGINSVALGRQIEATHKEDRSEPSLAQLFWREADFHPPGKAKEGKKGAADPTQPSTPALRGAQRMKAGENVAFKCIVNLRAMAIDGGHLSDVFRTWGNLAEWFVSLGLFAETAEGFEAMPDVVMDWDMRMRAVHIEFAYCSNGWKSGYLRAVKFPGFYSAQTAVAASRRARAQDARARRILSGERAYFFKIEGNEDGSAAPPAKRRRTAAPKPSPAPLPRSSSTSAPSSPRAPIEPVSNAPQTTTTLSSNVTPSSDRPLTAPISSAASPYDVDDSDEDLYSTDLTMQLMQSNKKKTLEASRSASPTYQCAIAEPEVPAIDDVFMHDDSAERPLLSSVKAPEPSTAVPAPAGVEGAEQLSLAQSSKPVTECLKDSTPSPPAGDGLQTTQASRKEARRMKASDQFASRRPKQPNTYAFPEPKLPIIATPVPTGTPASDAELVNAPLDSAAPLLTAPSSTTPGPISVGSADTPPLPQSALAAVPPRTHQSRAYAEAVASVGSIGGPLVKDGRKQRAPGAAEPRARTWNPGKGMDLIPACGRDWIEWPENKGTKRTLNHFWDFLVTQPRILVEKWHQNCVAETVGASSGAQGHAVKAEALAAIDPSGT